MMQPKIQSLAALREEMKAVARGERPAPADASAPSFNSVAAVLHLLTPENRMLLAAIRDGRPDSIDDLARLTGYEDDDLSARLAMLEAAGFVRLDVVNGHTVPVAMIGRLHIEVDPYTLNDRLEPV